MTNSPSHLARTDHSHHWRLADPNGPTSVGICRICGDERPFKNFVELDDLSEEDGFHHEPLDLARLLASLGVRPAIVIA